MAKQPPDKGGKGDAKEAISPNGLRIDRYIEKPSRQTRRIPVGVALIVDQEHVDRVLLAFSKSPLRFLTTQVILNRYPHSVRPNLATAEPKEKGNFLNPKGKGKGGTGEAVIPGGNPFFPMGGGIRQQAPPAAGSDQESNMELVIYGIVTLYERYPPRAKAK